MKKRTNRLLSVLLTLVMVLGLLPALGTTVLAAEDYDFYLEVGDNAFDTPEMKSIISNLTNGKATGLGVYRTLPAHYSGWSDKTEYYVKATSVDEDIISNEGLAKRPGECVLTIGNYEARNSSKLLKQVGVKICVTNARIDRVAVTSIDAPVTGQPLDMTAECSTPGIASVEVIKWHNSTDGVDVASGAVAQGGKAYSAFVTVTPASGYELVGYSTTKVTVNGGTASPVYGGTDYLTVAYHFPATGGENSENQNWVTTKKIISEVAVTDVVIPVDGAKPVETCKLGGTGYTLKSMSWYDGSLKMNSAGTFQAGKTYQARFYLLPEKGYTFNNADSMTATVNGKTVEVSNVYGEPEQRALVVNFTCASAAKTISSVDITGLDALKHGTAADYTASTSTAGCTVTKVEYQMFQKTFPDYVPADGDNIAVVVTVSAEDGYTFASGSTATWNGLTSNATLTGTSDNEKSYAFYIEVKADASQIVETAAMTVTAPEIGKTPSATVTGSGVEASSVTWSPSDATFKEGTAYTVSFTLKADATHVLADNFDTVGSVTLNGQKANLTSSVKGKFVIYTASYTFPALKAGVPVITTQPKSVIVKPGETATFTVTATGENLHYQWWMVDADVPTKVGTDSATLIMKDLDLGWDKFSFWCVISNDKGEVTSEKAQLTVSEKAPKSAFTDVQDGAYYADAVVWAVENNITSGTSATTFSPNATCTRAQMVTFLWRAAGSPTPKSKESAFADVAAEAYYSDAVLWAVENGITSGTGATTFSPNATCTRAQTVTFLWRSQKSPSVDSAVTFTDVAADTYYTGAVRWAVKNGITSGTSATTFSPNDDCSRAQIVTFLYRCLGK